MTKSSPPKKSVQAPKLGALPQWDLSDLYPGIDSPVIVTAWGYQLKLESADDGRLMQFISKYEQGPSTPELGASCSGGETRTLNQILLG